MTDQKATTAVEQALAAAGAEFTAALREVGLRLVATSALGQVIAGLPDAARGMVKAMPLDQRYALADALARLHDITAAELPETAAADKHQADTAPEVADSLRFGSLFATAYRAAQQPAVAVGVGRAGLRRQITDLAPTDDELRRTRQACTLLSRAVGALMPQAAEQ